MFPNYIDIGEKLAEDLAKSFPVDMAILKALKQSSLALDLYAWGNLKGLRYEECNGHSLDVNARAVR